MSRDRVPIRDTLFAASHMGRVQHVALEAHERRVDVMPCGASQTGDARYRVAIA